MAALGNWFLICTKEMTITEFLFGVVRCTQTSLFALRGPLIMGFLALYLYSYIHVRLYMWVCVCASPLVDLHSLYTVKTHLIFRERHNSKSVAMVIHDIFSLCCSYPKFCYSWAHAIVFCKAKNTDHRGDEIGDVMLAKYYNTGFFLTDIQASFLTCTCTLALTNNMKLDMKLRKIGCAFLKYAHLQKRSQLLKKLLKFDVRKLRTFYKKQTWAREFPVNMCE